jgi:hypothetical protein
VRGHAAQDASGGGRVEVLRSGQGLLGVGRILDDLAQGAQAEEEAMRVERLAMICIGVLAVGKIENIVMALYCQS